MKFKGLFLSLSVAAVFCTTATAQEWVGVNRDDFGNVVRGAYLTNEWFDNWYIGVAGGIETALSDINKARISPQVDITVLKWFTPSIGARLGYQGFSGKEYVESYNPYHINHAPLPFDGDLGHEGVLSYGLGYIHGDLMWNISNSIWGYKYRRFWNFIPYANAGFCRLYDNTNGQGFGSENHDNEFAFGAGILNTFRITDRLSASLDMRHFSTASRYKTLDGVRTHRLAATIGLSYNIYKTYWNRAQSIISSNAAAMADAAAAQKALEKAQAESAALEQKVAEKEKEIAERQKLQEQKDKEIADLTEQNRILDQSGQTTVMPYDSLVRRAEAAALVLYYYIDVDKLNFSELHHLDQYIQNTLAADPDHVFYLTGSADKGTGSMERNTFLCRSRAYGVRDILIKDYGVKEENVVIKASVVSDKHLNGALDRCVIIENE